MKTWIKNIAMNTLINNNEMGNNVSTSYDFLQTHHNLCKEIYVNILNIS